MLEKGIIFYGKIKDEGELNLFSIIGVLNFIELNRDEKKAGDYKDVINRCAVKVPCQVFKNVRDFFKNQNKNTRTRNVLGKV